MSWIDIGALDDIPRRGARVVKTVEGCVAVFRTQDDAVFALTDRCPHKGGPLSEGIVHGHKVTCPLHNWVFGLEDRRGTGRRRGPGADPCRAGRGRAGAAGRRAVGQTDGGVMDGTLPPRRERPAGAVRTTCPYCGVGCGVIARPDGLGGLTVAGDRAHPANAGRLCSKGSALGETMGPEGRLLVPRVNGAATGWDSALDLVAGRFAATIAEHGPDSVAFYVSGQMLTEDYYVANKLMKGFIGSANIDTNSRLCMASSVAGHRRAFGTDTVPGLYEDLEQADLIVLVGSNLAWCHPVLYQRIAAAKAGAAGAAGGRRSTRAAPRPATSPTCISRWRRAATWRCSTGCWPRSRRGARSTAPSLPTM